jgi:hypothetical protein
MKIFDGIIGLFQSRKGTLCIMILNCLTILTALGKVDGIAFCGGCTLISSIYMYTSHKQSIQQMAMGNKVP